MYSRSLTVLRLISGYPALSVVLWLALTVSPALGQTLEYLAGHDVTADKLISVLTPKEAPPSGNKVATRGLSFVAPPCMHFRKAAERGIALTPKADIAALTVEFESGSAELTPADEEVLKS